MTKPRPIRPVPANDGATPPRRPFKVGWSQGRQEERRDEKLLMAEHFVTHDFLAKDHNPETETRRKAASIIVAPGTTPNVVVAKATEWMAEVWDTTTGAFNVQWYAGGSLVGATLHDFKLQHAPYRSAAGLFLFPGPVDPDLESVVGEQPSRFVKELKVHFTYAILSAYTFAMPTGTAYFHFEPEIPFQTACANCAAEKKYLFLDSSKFQIAGHGAYSVRDLLKSCDKSLTIYSVLTKDNENITREFDRLVRTLDGKAEIEDGRTEVERVLRLCLLSSRGEQLEDIRQPIRL